MSWTQNLHILLNSERLNWSLSLILLGTKMKMSLLKLLDNAFSHLFIFVYHCYASFLLLLKLSSHINIAHEKQIHFTHFITPTNALLHDLVIRCGLRISTNRKQPCLLCFIWTALPSYGAAVDLLICAVYDFITRSCEVHQHVERWEWSMHVTSNVACTGVESMWHNGTVKTTFNT